MIKEVVLSSFEEYRFEVSRTGELKLTVTEGNCEVLGQEMIVGRTYLFKDTKLFIYTVSGCKVKVDGDADLEYVSSGGNMREVYSLFKSMYFDRRSTLVLGEARSTTCQVLVNLHVRAKCKVVFTELDPSTGTIVFPGVIASTQVDKIVEYDKGFEMPNTISFFNMSTKIDEDYFPVVESLSKIRHNDVDVILGPNDRNVIPRLIELFGVTRVVFVGDERLMHRVDVNGVEKVVLGKTTGYCSPEGDAAFRKIRSYFYGRYGELTPFSLNIKDQRIFCKNSETAAPESALPLGAARRMRVDSVIQSEFKENFLLGIMDCDGPDGIITSPVLGFLVGQDKDTKRVLSPQPKLAKEMILLMGEIRYFEG